MRVIRRALPGFLLGIVLVLEQPADYGVRMRIVGPVKVKAGRLLATGSASGTLKTELAAIDRAYQKVSKTRASARAFLLKAGIADKQGRLKRAYR